MYEPAFLALVFCDGAALGASMLGRLTLPWWIVHSGSTADLGVFLAALAVGSIVALLLLSPVGDLLRRDRAVHSGLALAIVAPAALWFLASVGHYDLRLLIACEAVGIVAFALALPALSALPGDMLTPGALPRGLAMQKTAQTIGRLTGPLLAGALLSVGGIAWALACQTALLLLAALVALGIPKQRRPVCNAAGTWMQQLRAGLVVKWRIPIERRWTLSSLMMMTLVNPAIGVLVVLKIKALSLSAGWFGALEASLSLGMLTGAIWVCAELTARIGRYATNAVALLLMGPTVSLIAVVEEPGVLLVLMAVLGCAIATIQLVGQTHRTLAVPVSFRGRFAAVNLMTLHLAGIVGPLIAVNAVDAAGIVGTHLMFGLGILCVAISYLLIPGLRQLLDMSHVDVVDWYRRSQPQAFPLDSKMGESEQARH